MAVKHPSAAATGGITAIIVNYQPKHTRSDPPRLSATYGPVRPRKKSQMTGTDVVLDAGTIRDKRR